MVAPDAMMAAVTTATNARRCRLALALVVLGVLAAASTACGREGGSGAIAPPTTRKVGNTDAYSYTLSCPSPVGNLTTSITYTVTDDYESVRPGETVTYRITAPIAQVDSPVTPTFKSSTSTFAIPKGFTPTSASMDPPRTDNFSSASAQIQGGNLVETLGGDFPLDGSDRPTPTIIVTGTVDAGAGESVTWMTPSSVSGKASVPILGDQDSSCTFPTAGPIGRTDIASG